MNLLYNLLGPNDVTHPSVLSLLIIDIPSLPVTTFVTAVRIASSSSAVASKSRGKVRVDYLLAGTHTLETNPLQYRFGNHDLSEQISPCKKELMRAASATINTNLLHYRLCFSD